jgi:uncharacterized membrane protein
VFDRIFEALFTYRPVVFQQGEFRFNSGTGAMVAAALVVAVMVLAILTYRGVRAKGRLRDRIVLTTLRMAALALVLFCLFRPTLVVRAAVAQQNVVAVLLDDSRSMQIPDVNGQARGEWVRQNFGGADSPILKALSDRFLLRVFRFSSASGRVESVNDLTFNGSQTRVGPALDDAREELAGLPVSGIVVVSDGADTTASSLADSLLGMKAERLPVFTVGVGSAQLTRDIQVDRVSVPRTVLKDASLLVDVVITQTGYAGRAVTVDVEDEGRIVGSQQVTFPQDGSPATVRVRATASDVGARLFRFRVPPQADEVVAQNNVREALIDVRDVRERILYFEGEPRFEMKFLRRAITEDENLELVVLQRTADNKFMRIGGDEEELQGGFPKTREELFQYRALILGSVEAAAFTGDQLQMIADFVDRRGGGLLVLGGARSFGEGGFGGTPVADALPLSIDPRVRASEPAELARLQIAPTRAGQSHAATQIAADETASVNRWRSLPQVTSVNAPLTPKPGATVLLTGTDERGRTHPVLTWQPYGRGKTVALTLQDTWQWQMHATIALEDMTHENYWRQLLRWLVDGVPGTVEGRPTVEQVEPGEAVTLEATVVDRAFVEVNDATVHATVMRPDGGTIDVPMLWTGERDGQYRGTFVTTAAGAYETTIDGSRGETILGSGVTYVRAGASDAEYFDPTMHEAPMRRIAEETGGRFYTPETVQGLPEDVRYAGRGVTSVEERELWNMPIILIALVGLICAEWGYRRAVGLS